MTEQTAADRAKAWTAEEREAFRDSVPVRHQFHKQDNGRFVISATQDVEPILDRNKALQNAGKQTGDLRLVASIPTIFVEKFLNERGVNVLKLGKQEFTQLIQKMRRDPDYRHLFIS